MSLQETFGSLVFNDAVMRQRLPKETYQVLHRTIAEGRTLNADVASVVANTMKDWAMEKGATHYTHWFQPMTGVTAEKHDSFLSPIEGGGAIMEFSGKELVRGESDASSFPSGGLRSTFEARGYTAWDPTSYAFIKGDTLCIPTAFCGYGGQALDKKTPLLRSMQALSHQAKRILRLFGHHDVKKVTATVGPEQEYFLIDRELYDQRKDLIYTGRTLLGARPPKGQELDDHYFGNLKPRVAAFMREVDEELWKLGVSAKTEHNEAAPCQHELAPIFTTANLATDHNQLTMETMRRVAAKHGFACLLHEKPFAGVNGSGKHNNWSMSTDTGMNLLEPGETPAENAQFLLFLVAVIKAVDLHQDLLRISVASAGNDHRLGAHEAPPAIVSIFLGDELQQILDALEHHNAYVAGEKTTMNIGVKTLPRIPKDTTDRNRTSPLAFTGNKFEFRMPGSAMSISEANVVLNTAVADVLADFADELEKADDLRAAVEQIVVDTITRHKRILFSGNSYSKEWKQEAEKRGLLNLPSTPDALPYLILPRNIALFERQRVYTGEEIHSRYEIQLENYCKILLIEGHTMLDMVNQEIIPAVMAYAKKVADSALAKRAFLPDLDLSCEERLVRRLNELLLGISEKARALEDSMNALPRDEKPLIRARHCRDQIFQAMESLRKLADQAEMITEESIWPFPGYGKLLTTK
ncbi:MAG: glutamine synthetase type III [Clostridiales bacterium]|nr:glutamine synthetase type III [Clostridiales bacterium]